MFSTKQLNYLKFRDNLLKNIVLYEDLIDVNSSETIIINNADQIMNSNYFDNWLVGFIEALRKKVVFLYINLPQIAPIIQLVLMFVKQVN